MASDRAKEPQVDDLFAYNVFSVSEADLKRIRELLRAVFRQIRSIVATSEPVEQVALLNLQLVGFNQKKTLIDESRHE